VVRLVRIVIVAVAIGGAGAAHVACGQRPLTQRPEAPAPSDLVVIEADPESGTVGQAVVSTPQGTVALTTAKEAARVRAGEAPAAAGQVDAADLDRIFGKAIAARPAAARHFLLYFEFGTDDLTAGSKVVLEEVVRFVRGSPLADATVIGHTDTAGDPAFNRQLGLQRATLIRNQLLQAGLSGERIDVASHAESDLLVTTADNVSEARNRRVEVTVF
jgi:outer membrane protein OmpA-like peptidoglycan-associated protein